ncbi:MAG TPA: aminotransferase class I/II-fold pyridoxal phosphate-dependent enzyme, partial [Candidatus Parabacteroides intestinavium]|nr:aminotransferase class I/II-fold pyridoxal phosphate-dependent enzyme [Candidatus Parabacteroides intestinavium]
LIRKMYPTDANFILVDVGDADKVYQRLVEQGIIVRNRNKVTLCAGCLRITVGTKEENEALLAALKAM